MIGSLLFQLLEEHKIEQSTHWVNKRGTAKFRIPSTRYDVYSDPVSKRSPIFLWQICVFCSPFWNRAVRSVQSGCIVQIFDVTDVAYPGANFSHLVVTNCYQPWIISIIRETRLEKIIQIKNDNNLIPIFYVIIREFGSEQFVQANTKSVHVRLCAIGVFALHPNNFRSLKWRILYWREPGRKHLKKRIM